jgi:hypothetical protein
VVTRQDVVLAGRNVVEAAKAKLLGLTYALAQRGGLAPGGAPIVDDVVRQALTELSRLDRAP